MLTWTLVNSIELSKKKKKKCFDIDQPCVCY